MGELGCVTAATTGASCFRASLWGAGSCVGCSAGGEVFVSVERAARVRRYAVASPWTIQTEIPV